MFVEGYNHSVPLTWFDVEMRQTLGIDVYAHPFPREQGHDVIVKDGFELLILKLEADDSTKARAIAEFLGLDDFALTRTNVGEDKDYAETYREFVRAIRLPKSYVEMMCDSVYTRHFYTSAETDQVRLRWHDRATTSEMPPAVHETLLKAASRIAS